MSLSVYIVMPDLSLSKVRAVELASRETDFGVLVSFSVIKMKPVTLERLALLRSLTDVPVMLDSGAYHLARLGVEVRVEEYAELASRNSRLFDTVVAPDIPGDCATTLERTRVFAKLYGDQFVPVTQGRSVRDYVLCSEELSEYAGEKLGVGGLDGEKKRAGFVSELVAALPSGLHIFGAGSRLVASLSRLGLARKIASIDSSGWLAEIRYRRRSVLKAENVVEANARAIVAYVDRVKRAYSKNALEP
ncbi:MAG: hypothetical protein QXS85_02085 [Acidilobaceae archaeon]